MAACILQLSSDSSRELNKREGGIFRRRIELLGLRIREVKLVRTYYLPTEMREASVSILIAGRSKCIHPYRGEKQVFDDRRKYLKDGID